MVEQMLVVECWSKLPLIKMLSRKISFFLCEDLWDLALLEKFNWIKIKFCFLNILTCGLKQPGPEKLMLNTAPLYSPWLIVQLWLCSIHRRGQN